MARRSFRRHYACRRRRRCGTADPGGGARCAADFHAPLRARGRRASGDRRRSRARALRSRVCRTLRRFRRLGAVQRTGEPCARACRRACERHRVDRVVPRFPRDTRRERPARHVCAGGTRRCGRREGCRHAGRRARRADAPRRDMAGEPFPCHSADQHVDGTARRGVAHCRFPVRIRAHVRRRRRQLGAGPARDRRVARDARNDAPGER